MASGQPVLYSTAFCPYCLLARRLLDRRGIRYDERRLSRRAADRDKVAAIAGGRRTYPQLIVDGRPLGGYAELRRLDRNGRLERALEPAT